VPVQSIRSFVYWTGLIISAFLFVFSRPIRDEVADYLTWLGIKNEDAVYFIVFVIGLFLLFAARLISERIPKYVPGVRAAIMRNNFIEGDWIDAVLSGDHRNVLSVGLIKISYKNGQLVAKGSDHDPDGAMHSVFESIISRIYDSGQYCYCYEATMLREAEFTHHRGYAQYSFLTGTGRASEFVGVYSSASTGKKHTIRGNMMAPALLAELGLDPKKDYLKADADRRTLIEAFAKFTTQQTRNDSRQTGG